MVRIPRLELPQATVQLAEHLTDELVIVAEAHAEDVPATVSVRDILRHADHMLLPQMTVQDAISAFDRFEAEALPVLDSAERRQVIGQLSEAHALRRYSDASERQRRELLGGNLAR
jgi:CIC family chloride channel protein